MVFREDDGGLLFFRQDGYGARHRFADFLIRQGAIRGRTGGCRRIFPAIAHIAGFHRAAATMTEHIKGLVAGDLEQHDRMID